MSSAKAAKKKKKPTPKPSAKVEKAPKSSLGAVLRPKLERARAAVPARAAPTRAAPTRAAPTHEPSGSAPETEAELFARAMRGTKPLSAEAARPARVAGSGPQPRPVWIDQPPEFEVVDDGRSLEGRRLDADPRELRKLRQARYAVDGTLDLHGLTLTEAREAVPTFLRRRREQGDRTVLVIHGKGRHAPRGVGVLRGELGAWLSEGPAAFHVLAFASMTDQRGETGAVLVLLAP